MRSASIPLPLPTEGGLIYRSFYILSTMTEQATAPPAPSHSSSSHIPTSPLPKRQKTEGHSHNITMPESTPTTKVEQSPPLLVKKLSTKAKTPTRGSAYAAGYDLYRCDLRRHLQRGEKLISTTAGKADIWCTTCSAHNTTIPARGKTLVDTDLAIAVPAGTCATVHLPRSKPS